MVDVDNSSLQANSQPKFVKYSEGRQTLGTLVHSSDEQGELSKWLVSYESTINIDKSYYYYYSFLKLLLVVLLLL